MSRDDNNEPRPGTTNPLVGPLLTDLYQLTMAYAYWKHGRHECPSVFELYFRRNPFGGEFTLFAGLEEVLRFVETFHFTAEDVQYVKDVLPKSCESEFFDWLEHLKPKNLKIYAIKEGTIVFPIEPLIRVEGPLALAQMLETTLLNLVNYASLICTNAARYRLAAGDSKKLFEFGARRAQGPDGAISAAKYAFVGGFDGTSNVLAGKLFRPYLPVSGTHSHAFVQSYRSLSDVEDDVAYFVKDSKSYNLKHRALYWRSCLNFDESRLHDGELAAFIAYAIAFPDAFVALVDTYSTLETGLQNFICVALALHDCGHQALGIRIDSGDLAYLSRCARDLFDTIATQLDDDNDSEHEGSGSCSTNPLVPKEEEEEEEVASSNTKKKKKKKKNCQADDRANALRRVMIVASNDINEDVLLSLREQDHAIDAFGIGTHLVTCYEQPALGCVYKLVDLDRRPCIKLSNDVSKTTIPCSKNVYRLISKDDVMLLDLLAPSSHAAPDVGERVLCRHPWDHQKCVYVTPSAVVPLHELYFDSSSSSSSFSSINTGGGLAPRHPPPETDTETETTTTRAASAAAAAASSSSSSPHRPSLEEIRAHVKTQLRLVRKDILRFLNPTPYKVSLTPELFAFFTDLRQRNEPILELE